ncbi:hypothetical protein [Actinomadura sp. 21ATH]|uniref:hypothetical protein n=1 Tax=Actinomadura sp. 21ATH TaxID=1735444 RepID=UPI0035BF24D2
MKITDVRRRRRKDRPPAPSVVDDVARQTGEAARLAEIVGQERLADPRTNPAVRRVADRLRDDQQRSALDAAHRRVLRGLRVEDRRAADAERGLLALQQAREASSPARSLLALHVGRTRFMGTVLGASVLLSCGAATGVAKYAESVEAPWQAGYLAEVGFTGTVTLVILYRSHLARHSDKDTKLPTWQQIVLWLLVGVPLAASVLANLAGAGPVGMACSIGAAALSLFSYVIADASAAAIQGQAQKVTGADEDQLRAAAMGRELFGAPDVLEPAVREEPAAAAGVRTEGGPDAVEAAQVQEYLAGLGLELSEQEVAYGLGEAPPAARTEPVRGGAVRREPARTEPVRLVAVRDEPATAGPVRNEPVRGEGPADTDSVRGPLEPVRTDEQAPRTGGRTGQQPTGADAARTEEPDGPGPRRTGRTVASRTARTEVTIDVRPSRTEWVEILAEEIRTERAAGRTWRPAYGALEERTGYKRSWCEKVVADARKRAAAAPVERPEAAAG